MSNLEIQEIQLVHAAPKRGVTGAAAIRAPRECSGDPASTRGIK